MYGFLKNKESSNLEQIIIKDLVKPLKQDSSDSDSEIGNINYTMTFAKKACSSSSSDDWKSAPKMC